MVRRITLAVGDTVGHCYPAIAVADAYRRRFPGTDVEALAHLEARGWSIEVRHQIGDLHADPIHRAYAGAGVRAALVPFIHDIARAYRWADVAIARAGAGTMVELAITRTPALLVPLADAADDHQTANARAFVEAGAGMWLPERDWRPDAAADRLARLIHTAASRRASQSAAPWLAMTGAADRIVDDCEELMGGRW